MKTEYFNYVLTIDDYNKFIDPKIPSSSFLISVYTVYDLEEWKQNF